MPARIRLKPVDRVEILTLVDNVTDALLPSTPVAQRLGLTGADAPAARAPLVESGRTLDGPIAEHGLALLVSIPSSPHGTVLLDTGSSVDGLCHNLRAMDVDPRGIETIVLSHGHFDHTMGLNGLAGLGPPLPAVLAHPDAWQRRRIVIPGREPFELPAVSKARVAAAGFSVIEEAGPSQLLDDCLLVTGEIERTTEFERGFPVHQTLRDGEWQADPLIRDDQALVAHVRGRGLVILTGCGHAGVVNTVHHARELTGVDRVHAVIGGFHLGGPLFEPVIPPTVRALGEVAPDVIAPTHCTGWRAIHALAAAFPDAFVQGSVGTRYVLDAEAA